MNTEKLSERLATVANYVPHDCRLADIGSDHAYLPCHLVKKGTVSFAVAGEVAEGPFRSALNQVRLEGLTKNIKVRKGDGLEVIQPGEVDCITIAGMGGPLISNILEAGKEKLEGITNLILQPNIGASHIRTWLLENNWRLASERILKEDGKIYEVLIADRGSSFDVYSDNRDLEILFGPHLLKEKSNIFREKWEMEKQNWQRILKQLEKAEQNEGTVARWNEIERKIKMAEEALS